MKNERIFGYPMFIYVHLWSCIFEETRCFWDQMQCHFSSQVRTPVPRCHGCLWHIDVQGSLRSFQGNKSSPRRSSLLELSGIGGTCLGLLRSRSWSSHSSRTPTGYKLNQEIATERDGLEAAPLNVSATVVVASSLLVLLLGLVATDESGNLLIVSDQSLHTYMFDRMSGSDHEFFNDVSNKLDDFVQYSSLLAALLNLVNFNTEGVILSCTLPGGLQLVRFFQRILKSGFHRTRPSGMVSDFSYPSAHTARFAFCLSLVLLVFLPRFTGRDRRATLDQWFLIAVTAWIIMGSCRMLADAHWFSDTVGGAALGVDVAAAVEICALLLQDSMRRDKKRCWFDAGSNSCSISW